MKKNTGFTLIELMIVVAILGVLAAVSMPLISVYKIRTERGVECKTPLYEIAAALEKFEERNGTYTQTFGTDPATDINYDSSPAGSDYTYSIAAGTTSDIRTSYVVTCNKVGGANHRDEYCSNMHLDNFGRESMDAAISDRSSEDCWR